MRPLQVRARIGAWDGPRLVKVAGIDEFAGGHYPLERMVLDVRNATASWSQSETLRSLPWAGFLGDETNCAPARSHIAVLDDPSAVRCGDVLEVNSGESAVALRYRRGDNGNVLFATERCNSYCLMCSQPPRQVEDDWRAVHLADLVDLIDKDESTVAISGGEPTLMGADLPKLVGHCARTLPRTRVHILSNGRLLGDGELARAFEDLHPQLTWGVPLYGDTYRLHDYVVQSEGAFAQTMRGLYALHRAKQRIEVRVVLVRPTVERLMPLARYIYRNLPFVEHVALMGVEPIGFAKAHRDVLWVDPVDAAPVLVESVGWLTRRGLSVSLYNLPLCALPKNLWPFTQRSISSWKQTYLPACASCAVRERCGGFFSWTTPAWMSRAIHPIALEDSPCTNH